MRFVVDRNVIMRLMTVFSVNQHGDENTEPIVGTVTFTV